MRLISILSVLASTAPAFGLTTVHLEATSTSFKPKESVFNNCKVAKGNLETKLKTDCDRLNGTLLNLEIYANLGSGQQSVCSLKAKGSCETPL